MRHPAYLLIQHSLVWSAVCAVAGAVALVPDVVGRRPLGPSAVTVGGITFAIALILFARAWLAARRLGRGTEALRTAVLNVVAGREDSLPTDLPGRQAPEVLAMLRALAEFQAGASRRDSAPDRRLITVLDSLQSGVITMTDTGLVSLVNGMAGELLNDHRVRVGTSLFAALHRESVLSALARARREQRPVETVVVRLDAVELQAHVASLPDLEGAVIVFPAYELDRHRPGLEFDLSLHDVPPPRTTVTRELTLDELSFAVLDTETTGLDAATDRVVSVGAVCGHGRRLFRHHIMDSLVNPGTRIPEASTAIHGITDAMVDDAQPFPEVWAAFQRLGRNRVLVGHNLPFDLAVLRAECERHGRPWAPPVFIDTLRLAALLNPHDTGYDLDALARHYGIAIQGRHTALGDALVTAELYLRMVPRLQQQGITTLGQLLDFHGLESVDVLAVQRSQGWVVSQPEGF